MGSFWSTIVADVQEALTSAAGGETSAEQTAASGSAGVPSVAGWSAFVTTIQGAWTELTDGRMWRSLGWILLGIVLMLLGVAWWIGPSAARRSPVAAVAEGLG